MNINENCENEISIEVESVRARINRILSSVTSNTFLTPYIALGRIQKELAPFHIFIPYNGTLLDSEEGFEVFDAVQYGAKSGMNDSGEVVTKTFSPYNIYFEYDRTDEGFYKIFCEIVNEEELEEIMDDIEEELNESVEHTQFVVNAINTFSNDKKNRATIKNIHKFKKHQIRNVLHKAHKFAKPTHKRKIEKILKDLDDHHITSQQKQELQQTNEEKVINKALNKIMTSRLGSAIVTDVLSPYAPPSGTMGIHTATTLALIAKDKLKKKLKEGKYSTAPGNDPYDPEEVTRDIEKDKMKKDTNKKNSIKSFIKNLVKEECWKNHKQVGMKKKDGKKVPNCVPVSEETLEEARRRIIAKKASAKQRLKYVKIKGELPPILSQKRSYKITDSEKNRLKKIIKSQAAQRKEARASKKSARLVKAEQGKPTAHAAMTLTATHQPSPSVSPVPVKQPMANSAHEMIKKFEHHVHQYGTTGDKSHLEAAHKASLSLYAYRMGGSSSSNTGFGKRIRDTAKGEFRQQQKVLKNMKSLHGHSLAGKVKSLFREEFGYEPQPLNEGKISKWLTAPIRRKNLIKKVEDNAAIHRKNTKEAKTEYADLNARAKRISTNLRSINYFDPKHDEMYKKLVTKRKEANNKLNVATKEGLITSKRSRTALKLSSGGKLPSFKKLEEGEVIDAKNKFADKKEKDSTKPKEIKNKKGGVWLIPRRK